MNEVEQSLNDDRYYFIKTEGEISIDWIKEVTGLKFFHGSVCNNRRTWPCGSTGDANRYDTHALEDVTRLYIHNDRVCSKNRAIIEQLSHHLTTRPDLQELLKSI